MIASLIIVLTILSYVLGWLIDVPGLVPFLNTLASFPFMVASLRRGRMRVAIVRMLLWALTLAVCATALSYIDPVRTDRLFLRGASYRMEMFAWVRTGHGAESTPSLFIPQQARDASIFAAAAATSGGVLAMPMGAALMNQMGHYVGTLAAASARPRVTMLLGWHPWAVIRIISFVAIGVVLSAPLLGRVLRFRVDWRAARSPLLWGCAGLIADVLLKWLLAPAWQTLLVHIVGW
jgi:hypothetical protein